MTRASIVALTALATLTVAACAPQDPATTGDDTTGDQAEDGAAEPGGIDGTFVAVDIDWEQAPDSLPAGEVTLELVNDGSIVHDLAVDELDEVVVGRVQGGQRATGTITLDADEYTFYCSVPGHREAGMEAAVRVE
jgi:plastocyanin